MSLTGRTRAAWLLTLIVTFISPQIVFAGGFVHSDVGCQYQDPGTYSSIDSQNIPVCLQFANCVNLHCQFNTVQSSLTAGLILPASLVIPLAIDNDAVVTRYLDRLKRPPKA